MIKSQGAKLSQRPSCLVVKGGWGGGGFRPIILETLIMRFGLKGKARTGPDFFRLVLGPCAQFYPFEASEQKWGQTPKSLPKEIEL